MKSTFSDTTNCVDVSLLDNDDFSSDEGRAVRVVDTKDPDGGALIFTPAEWDAFLAGAKAGEFDRARLTAGG